MCTIVRSMEGRTKILKYKYKYIANFALGLKYKYKYSFNCELVKFIGGMTSCLYMTFHCSHYKPKVQNYV